MPSFTNSPTAIWETVRRLLDENDHRWRFTRKGDKRPWCDIKASVAAKRRIRAAKQEALTERSLARAREGFGLALARYLDDSNIAVSHRGHRATLSISAEMTGPVRATSPSRTNLTGRLSCQLEAKLPGGIERRWADEADAALETRIPNILASFAVWAELGKR